MLHRLRPVPQRFDIVVKRIPLSRGQPCLGVGSGSQKKTRDGSRESQPYLPRCIVKRCWSERPILIVVVIGGVEVLAGAAASPLEASLNGNSSSSSGARVYCSSLGLSIMCMSSWRAGHHDIDLGSCQHRKSPQHACPLALGLLGSWLAAVG